MDDSIGAFTHDEGFSASLSTMEPIKLSPDDSIWINDGIIELDDETSICASPSCEEISVHADSESTNPHHKTITRNVSGEKCDCANAASGEVHAHRIEPRCNDQWKFAESDTATSQFGATGNLDSEDPKLGISQDPVCASAAVCAEATKAVLLIGTPAQDVQEETEETEDDVVEIAFKGENPGSGPVCPSTSPRDNIHSSREVKPIDELPSLPLSHSLQPSANQALSLSVVIEKPSVSRMDPSVSQSLLLKDVIVTRPGSRKRKAATQKVKSAKRVERSDKDLLSQTPGTRRSSRPTNGNSYCFKDEYGSVQQEFMALRQHIKDSESRCWKEIEEIHDRFQDEVRQAIDHLNNEMESHKAATARQLEIIKTDLMNGGFLEADV